jgi:hypothetical protein
LQSPRYRALSTADQSRMKQRLLRRRIKAADNALFAWPRADGDNKPGIGQFHEMPSGFLDCVAITSVEAMLGIAGVIHHDMNCHYLSPLSPFVGAQTDEARFRRDDAKAAPHATHAKSVGHLHRRECQRPARHPDTLPKIVMPGKVMKQSPLSGGTLAATVIHTPSAVLHRIFGPIAGASRRVWPRSCVPAARTNDRASQQVEASDVSYAITRQSGSLQTHLGFVLISRRKKTKRPSVRRSYSASYRHRSERPVVKKDRAYRETQP